MPVIFVCAVGGTYIQVMNVVLMHKVMVYKNMLHVYHIILYQLKLKKGMLNFHSHYDVMVYLHSFRPTTSGCWFCACLCRFFGS
jgi:hypothetical protein